VKLFGVKSHSTSASLEAGGEHTAVSMPPSNMVTEGTCTSAIHVRVHLSKGEKHLLKVKHCLAPPPLELQLVRPPVDAAAPVSSPDKCEQQL